MSHFYKIKKPHRAEFLDAVTTVPQAKKYMEAHGRHVVASVTTKLSIIPNPFLDTWKIKQAISEAKDHPAMESWEIEKRVWGMRIDPVSGREITSADFGTQFHCHIEKRLNGTSAKVDVEWCKYSNATMAWFEENVSKIYETETTYGSLDLNTAGQIDCIAKVNGVLSVIDYKTRAVNPEKPKSISSKVYETDVMQLATYAGILREHWSIPVGQKINCYTIIVDANGGSTHVKKHTKESLNKQFYRAVKTLKYYDDFNHLHPPICELSE
jgi:hypothetical protein